MRDDLATLVGSRICHDLISPIGAIGNGVELLELTSGTASPEISLISDSVQNANARIRFFRIAFGAAKDDQIVSRKDVLSILEATARGGRLTYYWQAEGNHTRTDVRIAFLLLLCFETAMPIGGEVSVQQIADQWVLTARSERLNIDPELWGSLQAHEQLVTQTAAQVQFALLPEVLHENGRDLEISFGDGNIVARF